MTKKLVIALLAATVLIAGCKPPQSSRTFADEDECEDAGMSDAFCDRLFPEAEDFFKKKSKSVPLAKTARQKPSYFSRARVTRKK
ncbi:hypothetical protein B9J07_28055 [Sinorhizobium sp. LM21]|uniref:hypothetical protein n=1 Tax=Sinorhizobium sp. LM21 TaxID=1449788 RepID=UPI0005D85727|nr:hypothetical protein [Sinorhizobium sp. LM21]AJW30154.1 hypothetical protein pLM21S1_p33 [Sinorhizobium sp. LM21]OWZ90442.1 hypothetical protein B9J07_28055 [Sinorhizobium sp. LM21]